MSIGDRSLVLQYTLTLAHNVPSRTAPKFRFRSNTALHTGALFFVDRVS